MLGLFGHNSEAYSTVGETHTTAARRHTQETTMKVTIDETCTGCTLCTQVCPVVFEMGDDNYAHILTDPVPSEEEDRVREAAESCPVEAIHIED